MSMTAASLLQNGLSAIVTNNLDQARLLLIAAVCEAEKTNDLHVLGAAGEALERLGEYATAWRGLAAVSSASSVPGPPEWDGSCLSGRTLVIEQRIRHVGAAIRMARLIGVAAKLAGKCIVLAESRLVPLFVRTFPNVEVRDQASRIELHYRGADVRASYETLCLHLAPTQASIIQSFIPLKADAEVARELRKAYFAASNTTRVRRLIGISWRSLNPKKEIFSLAEWADLLRHIEDTIFVSVQYGEAQKEVADLARLSDRVVIHDDTIDQFENIDLFSAQLVALDSILTISNSGAHLAGALDIPVNVILGSDQSLVWSYLSNREPWYPRTRKIRRAAQPWPKLRDDIVNNLLRAPIW